MHSRKTLLFTGVALMTCMLVLFCFSFNGNGAEIVVDDDGTGNYTSIGEAIQNANNGDTILVLDGTYTENPDVDKSVTIHSENGPDSCIVQAADDKDHVFDLRTDGITLQGFTIRDGTEWVAGVYAVGLSDCTVSGNKITNNFMGMAFEECQNWNINNNEVFENTGWTGFYLGYQSVNNSIDSNLISNNEGNGFYLGGGMDPSEGSNNNLIRGNTITGHQGTGEHVGLFVDHYCMNNLLDSNTIRENNEGILLNDGCDYNIITGNILDMNVYVGIGLINMFPEWDEIGNSNNDVNNNTVTNNGNGTNVSGGSKDNVFRDNEISGSTYWGMDARYNQGFVVDARQNYWGDPSGPYHAVNNTDGKGDEASDYVNYDSWLTGLSQNNPPEVTITEPLNNAVASGTVTIRGTATDSDGDETLDKVELSYALKDESRDGGSRNDNWTTVLGTATWAHVWDTTSLDNGDYTISVRAYDGELYSAVQEIVLKVNNSIVNYPAPPVVTIISPANNSKVSGDVEVKGTASDPNGNDTITKVSYVLNDGEWIDTTGKTAWIFTFDSTLLVNGENQIKVKAFDETGNSSEDISWVLIIDNPEDEDEDDDSGFPPAVEIGMVIACVSIAVAMKRKR